MKTPVVFTQEQMDQMANKPFDVYDREVRRNMAAFQSQQDAIQERIAAFNKSKQKWAVNEQETGRPEQSNPDQQHHSA